MKDEDMMMLLERSQWANSYATDGVIYLGVSGRFCFLEVNTTTDRWDGTNGCRRMGSTSFVILTSPSLPSTNTELMMGKMSTGKRGPASP